MQAYTNNFEGYLEGLSLMVFGEENQDLFEELKSYIQFNKTVPNLDELLAGRKIKYLHVEIFYDNMEILSNNSIQDIHDTINSKSEPSKFVDDARHITNHLNNIDVYLFDKTRMISQNKKAQYASQ